MKIIKIISCLLVCYLFICISSAKASDNIIEPGVGFNDIRVGYSKAPDVLKTYGLPEITQKEGSVEYFFYYDRYKLVFGIDQFSKAVLEVIMYSPVYELENGISVGCHIEDVQSVYGRGKLEKKAGGYYFLAYPMKGLAFVIDNEEVFAMSIRRKNYDSSGIPVPK